MDGHNVAPQYTEQRWYKYVSLFIHRETLLGQRTTMSVIQFTPTPPS